MRMSWLNYSYDGAVVMKAHIHKLLHCYSLHSFVAHVIIFNYRFIVPKLALHETFSYNKFTIFVFKLSNGIKY